MFPNVAKVKKELCGKQLILKCNSIFNHRTTKKFMTSNTGL